MTNLTLSEVYWEWKVFFPKYPEPNKDFNFWDKLEFYAWEYWPEVIHTEEGRYLPIIWKNLTTIVSDLILNPEIIDYYSKNFSETFSKDKIIPYNNSDYNEKINFLKNNSLVTPQPYENFPEEKYYINPEILYNLNSKNNLDKLTKNIAKRMILNLEQIKFLKNFPFVLKSNSWASWDWVRIIKNSNDLENALKYFNSEKELLVEEFINHINNYWVQIYIPKNWEIKVLSLTWQKTSINWEYEWSFIDKNKKINPKLKEICLEIWENARSLWFYWIAWLDFLEKENWDFIFIDPNFRVTWATNLVLLKDKFFEETWKNIILWQQFKYNWNNFSEFLDKSEKNNLYIMSAFNDKVKSIINGFCIYWTDTLNEIENNKKKLKEIWFNL